MSADGYSYVTEVPSLQISHHHSSSQHSSSQAQKSSSHGGSKQHQMPPHQNRTRRTQRRVTHNEKRYHSGWWCDRFFVFFFTNCYNVLSTQICFCCFLFVNKSVLIYLDKCNHNENKFVCSNSDFIVFISAL